MAGEFTTAGSGIWKLLNTGLGAAGTAMGATALGSKTSEQKVREIIREELGGGRHGGHGYGVNDTVVISQPCSDNTSVNRFELGQSQRISELESARETDMKILDVWKAAAASDQRQDEKFAQLTKSLTDYVIANNREVDSIKCEARINQQEIRDNLRFLDYKIDNNQKEVYAYVDCKTIPLEKKIGINQICPTPLAACTPLTANAQVLTTTAATTTGEVALNTQRVAK